MKAAFIKATLVAAAFGVFGVCSAQQATSNVNINGAANQTQAGALNSQVMDLGSVKSGGGNRRSNLTINGSVNQTQGGAWSPPVAVHPSVIHSPEHSMKPSHPCRFNAAASRSNAGGSPGAARWRFRPCRAARLAALACVLGLSGLPAAWAGDAHTDVVVGGSVDQRQSGAFNAQSMDLGSVKTGSGSRSASVTVAGSVSQRQSGSFNDQHLGVGDVRGNGSSQVTVLGSITQTQSGAFNSQDLQIGSVQGNGSSNVTVGNVTQKQSGVFGHQRTRIGVVR